MIAEASRTAIRALGINAAYNDGTSFGATNQGLNQFSLANSTGGVSPGLADLAPVSAVTLFGRGMIGGTRVTAFISALADNQYVRVLAEPNLVAKSGQEASFLAGGEFPIPVVQAVGTGSTSVSIEYKEFGVQLKFRPTVLGDNRILLQVSPEVSQLSNGPGAVEIQGFSIPAILTRRADTTLELNSGQTFAMAGLISQETQARSQSVPGLGSLPIIGSLFRSVRYQQGDTELVLLVTASLVEPESMAINPPVPGATHVVPSDWELYADGKLEGAHPKKLSAADQQWMQEAGFQNLKGSGAWATYQQTDPAK
jgi:pilus assembly protein CpaC